MAPSFMRMLPRSWVSGTKRGKAVAVTTVAGVLLYCWVMANRGGDGDVDGVRSIPASGPIRAGWQRASRWALMHIPHHADVLEERGAVRAGADHAHDLSVDPENHLQNGRFAGEHIDTAAARVVASPPPTTASPTAVKLSASREITFERNLGKSCQNYAEKPPVDRTLQESFIACKVSELCNSIECPHGTTNACTLRALTVPIDYGPADCYIKIDPENELAKVHPMYNSLLKEYPFQAVTTGTGIQVNILLVRAPFGASGNAAKERGLYEKYRDDILFMGISSFEDYPMDAHNPFSPRLDQDYFLGAFPGFLHMMRHPEQHFPPHVKTVLMSQSDFYYPEFDPRTLDVPKKYDFTYAATWPLGPSPNTECIGWAGYCKNWSMVQQALHVFCGERNMTGVLVATTNLAGTIKCDLPPSCDGKITQTSFINQAQYFNYVKQSRFVFIPQIHDASPRVSTQALVHNVPVLMNRYISGGWKYVNDKTGEFFSDMTDFRASLDRIMHGAATPGHYTPRDWVLANYGSANSGKRFLKFVQDNFGDRVHLPKHTTMLLP